MSVAGSACRNGRHEAGQAATKPDCGIWYGARQQVIEEPRTNDPRGDVETSRKINQPRDGKLGATALAKTVRANARPARTGN